VLDADPLGAVQQCVDQREPDDVRLGATSRRARKARLTSGQFAVGRDPSLTRSVIEHDRTVRGGEAQSEPDGVADFDKLLVVDRAAEVRPAVRDDDEGVRPGRPLSKAIGPHLLNHDVRSGRRRYAGLL
jgi:hypothetical protein